MQKSSALGQIIVQIVPNYKNLNVKHFPWHLSKMRKLVDLTKMSWKIMYIKNLLVYKTINIKNLLTTKTINIKKVYDISVQIDFNC